MAWEEGKNREVQGAGLFMVWFVPTQSTVSTGPLLTHSCAGPLMWPQVPPMGRQALKSTCSHMVLFEPEA